MIKRVIKVGMLILFILTLVYLNNVEAASGDLSNNKPDLILLDPLFLLLAVIVFIVSLIIFILVKYLEKKSKFNKENFMIKKVTSLINDGFLLLSINDVQGANKKYQDANVLINDYEIPDRIIKEKITKLYKSINGLSN